MMDGDQAMKIGPIAVGALCLVGLGAWLVWPSDPEVDLPRVEREIAAGIEDQAGFSNVTVDCPSQIEWETGGSFRCFASDGSGQARVTVYMENDDGELSWVVE